MNELPDPFPPDVDVTVDTLPQNLPPPPRVPEEFLEVPIGSIAEIGLRIANLSDALLSPDGVISEMRREMRAHQRETINGIKTIVNMLADVQRRLDMAENDIEITRGEMRNFIEPSQHNGNGNGHG